MIIDGINGYLSVIKSLNIELDTTSNKILLLAKEYEMAKLLMILPVIGYYSALLIVNEIGISIDFLISTSVIIDH